MGLTLLEKRNFTAATGGLYAVLLITPIFIFIFFGLALIPWVENAIPKFHAVPILQWDKCVISRNSVQQSNKNPLYREFEYREMYTKLK